MPQPATLILRARTVLPISQKPIQDGAVVVSGDRIVAVGNWKHLRGRFTGGAIDLGDCQLLPGLINAHCHLDYTGMAGLFPPPRSFCDWIKSITTEKSFWGFSEYAESWIEGARMLVRNGTTTVVDIEAVPELLPDVWETTPMRVISLFEMTGVRSRRAPRSILAEALEKIDSLPHDRCATGLSPHAPYSTMPELMELSGRAAKERSLLVATHVAESAVEFEMFLHGRGELYDWLHRNERDMTDCGKISPVRHLSRSGLLRKNLLAVHVNYLAPGDAELLARKRVHVVHCPRSHNYFSHAAFPFRALKKAGVNVCLGTDSLATVRKKPRQKVELNLFEEMRTLSHTNPGLAPRQIVRMATTGGAAALGWTGQAGQLCPGAKADLIALPFSGKLAESYDGVLQHLGTVAASMISGQWAIPPRGP